jgi:hypothetical protein
MPGALPKMTFAMSLVSSFLFWSPQRPVPNNVESGEGLGEDRAATGAPLACTISYRTQNSNTKMRRQRAVTRCSNLSQYADVSLRRWGLPTRRWRAQGGVPSHWRSRPSRAGEASPGVNPTQAPMYSCSTIH